MKEIIKYLESQLVISDTDITKAEENLKFHKERKESVIQLLKSLNSNINQN